MGGAGPQDIALMTPPNPSGNEGELMMDDVERIARMAGAIWLGVDPSSKGDWYCEIRHEKDGTITILDSYQLPRTYLQENPDNA